MNPPFSSFIKLSFLLSISLFVGACSLYKSTGRKNFESSAKENLDLQDFKPIQCDEISNVAYWYETRFSSPHSQWIESLPNFEVWQDDLEGSSIQI